MHTSLSMGKRRGNVAGGREMRRAMFNSQVFSEDSFWKMLLIPLER